MVRWNKEHLKGESQYPDEPTRELVRKRVRTIMEREHRDKEHGSEENATQDLKRKSHCSDVPKVPELKKKIFDSLKKMKQHVRTDPQDAKKMVVNWITRREIGLQYPLSEAYWQWEHFCFSGSTKLIYKGGESEERVAMTQANAYAYWSSQGHSSSDFEFQFAFLFS